MVDRDSSSSDSDESAHQGDNADIGESTEKAETSDEATSDVDVAAPLGEDESGVSLAEDESEATFYDGAPLPDDYIDEALLRVVRRPPNFQLFVVLLVMLFGVLVANTFRNEILYFFSSSEPVVIGPIEELATILDAEPGYLEQFGSNVYVSLSGIPQNAAVADGTRYQQLVGGPVFVQDEREHDPLMEDVRPRIGPFDNPFEVSYIEGNGRFLAFTDLSPRQGNLIEFYRDNYHLWFCGQEPTAHQNQYRRLLREEYETELRQAEQRPPTREEIAEFDARVEAEFVCQNGYLFQLDVAPSDHTLYLGLFAFFLVVELFGVYYLVSWFRQLRIWSENNE